MKPAWPLCRRDSAERIKLAKREWQVLPGSPRWETSVAKSASTAVATAPHLPLALDRRGLRAEPGPVLDRWG